MVLALATLILPMPAGTGDAADRRRPGPASATGGNSIKAGRGARTGGVGTAAANAAPVAVNAWLGRGHQPAWKYGPVR